MTPGETFFSKKESLPRAPVKENHLLEVGESFLVWANRGEQRRDLLLVLR